MSFKYRTDYPSIGRAFIFNQKNFEKPEMRRSGTNKDEYRLEEVLESIGFETDVFRDLSLEEILSEIDDASRMDYSDYSSVIITIMTHGGSGDRLIASDGAEFSLKDMSRPFKDTRTLRGKPKVFFIQACRGGSFDPGYELQTDNAGSFSSRPLTRKPTIPTEADFLFAYAAAPNFVSFRTKAEGSWFIQTLCDVIEQYRKKEHLADMLTKVQYIVAREFERGNFGSGKNPEYSKQMPTVETRLTKPFYLFKDKMSK